MELITVFGRHGCHLCDVAIDVLESMKSELNFEIEIDRDVPVLVESD